MAIETKVFLVFAGLTGLKESVFPFEVLGSLIEFDLPGVEFEDELFGVLSLDGGGELVGKDKLVSMFSGRKVVVLLTLLLLFFSSRLSEHSPVLFDVHAFLFEFGERVDFQVLAEDALDGLSPAVLLLVVVGLSEEGHFAEPEKFMALLIVFLVSVDNPLAFHGFLALIREGNYTFFGGCFLAKTSMAGDRLLDGFVVSEDVAVEQQLVGFFVDLYPQNGIVENDAKLALQVGLYLDALEMLFHEEDSDFDVEEHEKFKEVGVSETLVQEQVSVELLDPAVEVEEGSVG